MKYSVVAFDWDGTLANSTGVIVESLQYANQQMGLNPVSEQEAKSVIGLSLFNMLTHLVPELPEEKYSKYLEYYVSYYLKLEDSIELFEGIFPLLETLKNSGIKIAIVTGKSRKGVDRILKRMELLNFFDATYCANEYASKPDPMMLNALLREFNVTDNHVLMVGDALYDVQIAHNANCDSVAVTYGAGSLEQLAQAQPTYLVHSVSELRKLLLSAC